MTHPPTVSSATQAGFDGTIRIPHPSCGWEKDFPFHLLRGFGFDALTNAIKAGRAKRNTIIWVKDEEKLFYLNREGKLYELTFTEV